MRVHPRIETCPDAWANPIEAHFGPLRSFVLANSAYTNHVALARALHAPLRWRNATPGIPTCSPPNAENALASAAEQQLVQGRPHAGFALNFVILPVELAIHQYRGEHFDRKPPGFNTGSPSASTVSSQTVSSVSR